MLIMLMAVVLLFLGFIIGMAFNPRQGGFFGIIIAAVVWLILTLISFSSGDQIFLNASKAKPVTHDDHPQLFNVVEEMKIAAGLPAMPKIYIIADPAPNAFATGRNPQNASIAVSTGLLEIMNRQELQGVIAHEIAHIRNYDMLLMTVVAAIGGMIVLLRDFFLHSMFWGGRRRSSRKGGGQAGAILLVIGLVLAIIAPFFVMLIRAAISRQREYLADASGAYITRYPQGLAEALAKLRNAYKPLKRASQSNAHLFISSPFGKDRTNVSGLFSTHPPLEQRIERLKSIVI